MTPPGWEEEEEEDSPWMEEYDDDYGDEDLEEDDEDYLDDEYAEYEESEDEEEEDELESLIDEGEALIEEGEYLQALELFREAAERFPDSSLAVFHVGQTALMLFTDGVESTANWEDDDDLMGFYDEAMTAFDSALSLDDEYYPALNGQGALLMVGDNIDAAIECWEKSLDIHADQEEIEAALVEARSQAEESDDEEE